MSNFTNISKYFGTNPTEEDNKRQIVVQAALELLKDNYSNQTMIINTPDGDRDEINKKIEKLNRMPLNHSIKCIPSKGYNINPVKFLADQIEEALKTPDE